MKINKIYNEIINDIKTAKIGKSGDLFFTAEEIMNRYAVSYITSLKLINLLTENKYLIPIGNKKYIMNGLYYKNCALYSLIDSPRKKIGIVFQNITNPFFASITDSLNSLIVAKGFLPVIKISTRETEADILISLIQEGCQGIFSFFQNSDPYIIDIYERLPVPIVFINDKIPLENCSVVNSDNLRSGYQAAKHLAEYGYKSFYFCALTKNENPRLQGFLNYLKENDLPIDDSHILTFNLTNPYENHYIIKTIMNDNADRIGIFCFHDLIAEYLYNLCTLNGISVPDKVGIVGYDKLDSMIPSNINLTTFSYSFKNIANSALRLLIENMDTLVTQKKVVSETTFLSIGKTTAKL